MKPPNSWRFINRDGTINIDRSGFRREITSDLYYVLLSTSWPILFVLVLCGYLLINLIFGSCYFLAGPEALQGLEQGTSWDRWFECFFFSVQTLATIGYGRISPVSIPAHLLVTIEAMVGLVSLATTTGIIFARISRPTARVKFSDQAIIGNVASRPCLMFRMANSRLNQIVEARMRVVLARTEKTEEGLSFRELYDLTLEREINPIFAMSWTVLHWIDGSSPLLGATEKSLAGSDTELIVALTGMDETLSQIVHTRHSYSANDIIWHSSFEDMISWSEDGKLRVSLEKISRVKYCSRTDS